jgi:hypothetical protein
MPAGKAAVHNHGLCAHTLQLEEAASTNAAHLPVHCQQPARHFWCLQPYIAPSIQKKAVVIIMRCV